MRGLPAKGKGAGQSPGGGTRGSADTHGSHFPQGRVVGFSHPIAHLIRVWRKFQLDRRGAGKTSVPNGGKVLSERRISSSWREVAMIEAIPIGDVNLSYPVLEPIERGGRNSHEPEMRDVHCRFNVLEADIIRKSSQAAYVWR